MSVLRPGQGPGFESWMRLNYPELVEEWEVEASEYLELEEWVDRLHWLVPIRTEVKDVRRKQPDNYPARIGKAG